MTESQNGQNEEKVRNRWLA